jgi:hypothetical protein
MAQNNPVAPAGTPVVENGQARYEMSMLAPSLWWANR